MTKAVLIKTRSGLFMPAIDEDREAFGKVSQGEAITVSFSRTRSLPQHKFGFALVNAMFSNQDHFEDREIYRTWLKMQIGDVKLAKAPDNSIVLKELSWEFGQMPQERYEVTVDKLKRFAKDEYGIDLKGDFIDLEQYA